MSPNPVTFWEPQSDIRKIVYLSCLWKSLINGKGRTVFHIRLAILTCSNDYKVCQALAQRKIFLGCNEGGEK